MHKAGSFPMPRYWGPPRRQASIWETCPLPGVARRSPAGPPRLPPALPLQLSLAGRTRQPLLPGPAAAGLPSSVLRRAHSRVREFRGWRVPGAWPPAGPTSARLAGLPNFPPRPLLAAALGARSEGSQTSILTPPRGLRKSLHLILLRHRGSKNDIL